VLHREGWLLDPAWNSEWPHVSLRRWRRPPNGPTAALGVRRGGMTLTAAEDGRVSRMTEQSVSPRSDADDIRAATRETTADDQ